MMSFFLLALLALVSAGKTKPVTTDTPVATSATTSTTTPPGGFVYSVELDRMLFSVFYDAGDYEYVSVDVVGHSTSGFETGLSWMSPQVDVVQNHLVDDDSAEWMDFERATGVFNDT